jgi:ribosomal protein L32E
MITFERKKPKFWRKDYNKRLRLGSGQKSERKWRFSKGSDSAVRMGQKGYRRRPKIGWGVPSDEKGKIKNLLPIRVENLFQFEQVKDNKVYGIIIGRIGKKKRNEIIAKAKEKNIMILNKYTGGKK